MKTNLPATKEDLKKFEKAIRASVRLDFEDFKQEIDEKLNLLPTKDEFFNSVLEKTANVVVA